MELENRLGVAEPPCEEADVPGVDGCSEDLLNHREEVVQRADRGKRTESGIAEDPPRRGEVEGRLNGREGDALVEEVLGEAAIHNPHHLCSARRRSS